MPIAFIEPKRRQQYLILLLIVVVLGILFLVWNYFLAKPLPPVFPPVPPSEIKINFEILGTPFLIESQSFEEITPPGAKDISLTPTLSWQSVSGAEIYLWEIIGVESGQTEQTSVTISKKLKPSTTYVWRVSSCKKDMSECSAWSSGGFTTLEEPFRSLISPVSGAKDISLTPTLSWQSVSGAEIYLWEIIGVESGQTEQTSVTISKKLKPSTTYVWRVSSCKKDMSECSVRRSGTFTTVSGLFPPELVSPPIGETFVGRDNPFVPYKIEEKIGETE